MVTTEAAPQVQSSQEVLHVLKQATYFVIFAVPNTRETIGTKQIARQQFKLSLMPNNFEVLPPVPCTGGDWPAAARMGRALRRGAAPPVDVAHPGRLWSLFSCRPAMVETIRRSDGLSESRLIIRH